MAKKNLHQVRKNLIRDFAARHFQAEHPSLNIHGVLVDKADGEPRVVILAGEGTDLKLLHKLAAGCFGEHPFRIVEIDEPPASTAGMAQSGIGVVRQGSSDFGTVGGWFRIEKDRHGNPVDPNATFGVSNNHVIGNCGNSAPGDVLTDVQGQIMGRLHDLVPLNPNGPNDLDAAIFQLERGVETAWNPARPVGQTGGMVDFRVYKQGARTGYTEGVVTGTGDIRAELCGVTYWFSDVLMIRGTSGEFSGQGDSGSLVMTMNHNIVGLLFAKAGEFAYACRTKHLGDFNLLF